MVFFVYFRLISSSSRLASLKSHDPFPSVVLPDYYSKHERPEKQVEVNFSINLSSILAVDEPNQVSH